MADSIGSYWYAASFDAARERLLEMLRTYRTIVAGGRVWLSLDQADEMFCTTCVRIHDALGELLQRLFPGTQEPAVVMPQQTDRSRKLYGYLQKFRDVRCGEVDGEIRVRIVDPCFRGLDYATRSTYLRFFFDRLDEQERACTRVWYYAPDDLADFDEWLRPRPQQTTT